MTQIAHIKDGVVVNIILSAPNVADTPPPPADHDDVVLADGSQVAIGWLYDGTNFSEPPASQDDLMQHAFDRFTDYASFTVTLLDGTDVHVNHQTIDTMRRLAQMANKDKNLSFAWPTESQIDFIMLNSAQVIEADGEVTKQTQARIDGYTQLVNDIQSGKVTRQRQVDDVGVYGWPPRTEKEAKSAAARTPKKKPKPK